MPRASARCGAARHRIAAWRLLRRATRLPWENAADAFGHCGRAPPAWQATVARISQIAAQLLQGCSVEHGGSTGTARCVQLSQPSGGLGLRKRTVMMLLAAGCTKGEARSTTGRTARVVERCAAQVNQRELAASPTLRWEQLASGCLKQNRRRTSECQALWKTRSAKSAKYWSG